MYRLGFAGVILLLSLGTHVHAMNCGIDKLTGKKKTTQLCEMLDSKTVAYAGRAYAACGNYFVKGTGLEQLAKQQFVSQGKSMVVRVASTYSKRPIKISVSISKGTCRVSVEPTTTQDGRNLGDEYFRVLSPLGFRKKLQIVNAYVAHPKLFRGSQQWGMDFRLPVPVGKTTLSMSPPR